MRISISDKIIELAKEHPDKKLEIYWAALLYYLDNEVKYSWLLKYLDPNIWRSEKMKDKKNRLGRSKNKTWQDLNLRPGSTKKISAGRTKKPHTKPTKTETSDETLAIYISNNKWLYDIVYRYIENNKEYWSIVYQINKQWKEKYIYSQMKESEKLIKEIWFKDFENLLNYISKDEFRSKQILSIAKLNRKNKEWIPYYLVIKDKMKPHTIRDQERERQIELHRQKIREQIESFNSQDKQNAETWLQTWWYNRRENIRLSDISW